MNVSFEPFRIVNSYGAFGSVTKVRHEVIIYSYHLYHNIDIFLHAGMKEVMQRHLHTTC